MELSGQFLFFDKKNGNGRIYKKEISDDILKQWDHMEKPIYGQIQYERTESEVSLDNISHEVKEIHYCASTNSIDGTIKLLDTPKGNLITTLLEQTQNRRVNVLSVASRGIGSVDASGYVKDYKLLTFDITQKPSFYEAELITVDTSIANKWNPKNNYTIEDL